jgi:hypothetical protein
MRRRYLPSTRAGERVIEWLDDENEPVRWQYGEIVNNSGVPTETVLKKFSWRLSTINWEETSAARKVESPPVAVHGGVTPGGVAWTSYPRPAQPVSQLGYNFIIYGIRLAQEDIERRLAGYDEPAKPRGATEQWVYNRMKSDPPEKVSEGGYAGKIFLDRPDKSVGLKTVQNLVADIRKELKLPSPRKSRKH